MPYYLSETSECGCGGTDGASPGIAADGGCCCCVPACPFWTVADCVEREEGVVVLFMLPKGGKDEGLFAEIPPPELEEEDEVAVVVMVELAVVVAEVMALFEFIGTALLGADEGVDDGVELPPT